MSLIPWYFDPISPFAWLAWNHLQRAGLRARMQPRPILFAGLLDHYGNVGPAEIPSKRQFTYRLVQWRAEEQRIPFHFPPAHPFNPLNALRLCIAAGSTESAVSSVLEFVWAQGRDPSQPDEATLLAAQLGIEDPAAALTDPRIKQQLRDNFEAALADGVFGVPTAVFEGQRYWGDDCVPMLSQAIAEPERFRAAPFSDLDELPMGVARKR